MAANIPGSEQGGDHVPKLRTKAKNVLLGAPYPGSVSLAVALLTAAFLYLFAEIFVNEPALGFNGTAGLPTSIGGFIFSIFIACSFGFLALIIFGRSIAGAGKWGSAAIMAIILFLGVKYGDGLIGIFGGASIPQVALSVTGGSIAGYQLPFGFWIYGVDYTWLLILLVIGFVYICIDDWWLWAHGEFFKAESA